MTFSGFYAKIVLTSNFKELKAVGLRNMSESMKCQSNKSDTTGENTINDSYLITDDKGTIKIISYRSNLLNEFRRLNEELYSEISGFDAYDICELRKIVSKAHDYNYKVYQLTQL